MKLWLCLIALLLGMTLLPSCRQKSPINSRIVVTAIGIDGDERQCHLSVQAIEALKTSGSLAEQQENATQIYQSDAASVAAAIDTFVTQTGRNAYILHNRVIAIGMQQAKSQPLPSLIDYFVRNHEGRPVVDMVVCRGQAADLLKVPSASFTIPAEHLSQLLEEGQRQGYVARARLLDVERAASGMFDAIIPIVAVEGKGEEATFIMDGTAFYRDGQYAGEMDLAATRGLLFARGEVERCLYTLEIPQLGPITAEVQSASTVIDITADGDKPVFTFHVSCKAEIEEEYSVRDLEDAQLAEIETRLSAQIRSDIEAAIDVTVRQAGADVFGLTRRTKKQAPSLIRGREERWPEQLRACRFNVQTDAVIDKIGAESGRRVHRVS